MAYASAVAGRLLSVPLILAIAVAAFWLAEYVYDAASLLGDNADQALGLLTLFAGVTFFFNLGLTHLKEQCEALGRECMAYLRSLFERGTGSFRKSATALMKRMVPILLDDGVGEMAVDLRESDDGGVSANVAGIRNSIRNVFIEALDERASPVAPDPDWECANVAFASGIEYDPVLNGDLIQRLTGALAPCGEEDGTRPVWIGVRGYASSAQFRNPREKYGKARPSSMFASPIGEDAAWRTRCKWPYAMPMPGGGSGLCLRLTTRNRLN